MRKNFFLVLHFDFYKKGEKRRVCVYDIDKYINISPQKGEWGRNLVDHTLRYDQLFSYVEKTQKNRHIIRICRFVKLRVYRLQIINLPHVFYLIDY